MDNQLVQLSYDTGVGFMLEHVLAIQTVPETAGAVSVQYILGVESVLSSILLHKVIFSALDLAEVA